MSSLQKGKQRIHEILGVDADKIIENFSKISPDFAHYIVEFAYGNLYARPGLEDKMREVAAVSCLIGQGNQGLALKTHLSGMLNVGWTKQEVVELLLFLIGYCGFPKIVDAMLVAKELFEKR
jgi:4-carboxymuconolactone decarboxylase